MSVSTISTPATGTKEEVVEAAGKDSKESKDEYLENLVQILCIRYPLIFRKKSVSVLTLLDLGSKVNAIYPTFAWGLGLSIRPTDVEAKKYDGIMLNTFRMLVSAFLVIDKVNRVRFFWRDLPGS